MNKEYQNLTKWIIVFLFLGMLLVSSSVLAQRPRRDDASRQTRTSEQDLRKEEMRKKASESFPELRDALKDILEKVVKNQRPEPKIIEQSAKLLEKNKRNGSAYDDKQKAQFMLLQAWTGFYQDNPVDAVRWSMRACKTNEASQDAWISQALFCVLNDKRPMKPRQPKPRSQSRRRPRRNVDAEYSAKPKPFSEPGVLQFDLMGLREKVFRQQFGRLEFSSVGGEKIEFEPEGDTLCILLWQDQEEVSDANEPVDAAEQISEQPGMEMMMEYGMAADKDRQTPLKEQRDYFRMLKEACKENERIKFVQINTNAIEVSKRVAGELAQDPSIEEAGLLVFAADPSSNAQRFIGWDAKKPFMTIIGKEGKIKYAGTAADFMPAFILSALTGIEIDLEKQNQPAALSQTGRPSFEEMPEFDPMFMKGMITRGPAQPVKPIVDPNQPVADPNRIVSDPNAVTTVQPTQQIKELQFPKDPAKQAMPLLGLTWIKGKPVKFQPGEVYVVEFWATWCPPCKASIPHLTEIQKKYKDKGVTVIGITNETDLGEVKKFVAEQGNKMDYTVAIDKSGRANAAYMRAYRQNGIPSAFVVDGAGRVVWYGPPMGDLDVVLGYLTAKKRTETDTVMNSPNRQAKPERLAPPSPATKRSSDFPTQSLENQVRAENLLRSAQMHIEESRKLRMKNPKQGIEDARRVLTEFPNTEHAQKARELLRRVPDRWKKKHGITDEELGF
ncbi:MAG: TlpA family protein disulfide reductase [Planctomycetes bacterium]|nr:TlpA family protein disulfide reductase [Planctomycetota bacterium]